MPSPSIATILGWDAMQAAPALLGYRLVHHSPEGTTSGIIIETEAYHQHDPASHSYGGPTARTQVMFGPPGYAYVYFTYGMHYCFNVVAGSEGDGQAILIRALEPVEGIGLMYKRRFGRILARPSRAPSSDKDFRNLCNGPAKLVQAMGITKADYGTNLLGGHRLRLLPGQPPAQITQTSRIGIRRAVDTPARFYIAGNPFVSRP